MLRFKQCKSEKEIHLSIIIQYNDTKVGSDIK